jgi:hypothetical protein
LTWQHPSLAQDKVHFRPVRQLPHEDCYTVVLPAIRQYATVQMEIERSFTRGEHRGRKLKEFTAPMLPITPCQVVNHKSPT